ncbi:oligosaccharide flippase family protein [Enterococcus mundtii]|uniref:oligosaccharide flippase family protein n=1 Tax=Enterococcus TaxID=1350 RepID=UPI0032DEE820
MKKVFSNFMYQALYQLMKIIIPIVTIPIVSRILGPNGVGIYNYTYSIVSYFVLFSGLGITLYGSREIARSREDKEEMSRVFWEIFNLKAFLVLINFIVFLIVSSYLDYSLYFYLQVLSVVSVLFDVSWFYMGIEDFRRTMLANIASQIAVFILIILLIKKESDLEKYVFIQSLSFILPQIYPFLYLRKYIFLKKTKLKNVLVRIKYAVNYFIPQIAIILYTTLNKTLLGIFVNPTAVGYYTSSLTMNLVFTTLITSFDTVMLPRMSNMYQKNKEDEMLVTLEKTTDGQLFFSIPIMFGMLTIYDKFVPWFLGSQFMFVNQLIPYFSVLIVVVPLGMAISRQYLIPVGKVKQYNFSVILGAMISIVTNVILLPRIGIYGSVCANIFAECFVLFSRIISLYKYTSFKFNYQHIVEYLFSAFIMCLVTRILTDSNPPTLQTNIIQALLGSTIYLSITFIFKCNLLYNLWNSKH